MFSRRKVENRLLKALRDSNATDGDVDRLAAHIEKLMALPGNDCVEITLLPSNDRVIWLTDSPKIRAKRAGTYPA